MVLIFQTIILNASEIARCALVCRKWKEATETNFLLKIRLRQIDPELLKKFSLVQPSGVGVNWKNVFKLASNKHKAFAQKNKAQEQQLEIEKVSQVVSKSVTAGLFLLFLKAIYKS